MAEEEKEQPGKKRGFWTTLPGILTGIAAVITAVTGLVLGLYQYGILGPKQDAAGKATGAEPTAQMRKPEELKQPTQASTALPATTSKQQNTHDATVLITAKDGSVTAVFAGNFHIAAKGPNLALLSGQTISFDKVKMIDVVRAYEDRVKIEIVLLDGNIVEGFISSGLYAHSFVGENELGSFEISPSKVKRIVFQR